MATYCIEIDGTIFATENSDYPYSKPIRHRIALVNKLCNEGYKITIFTTRGTLTGIDWREQTIGQLKKWRVRYHKLILEKPHADIFNDDKGANDKDFFSEADASQSASDDEGGDRP